MINIEDYVDLAHFYANKSNKRHLQGVELDDLYQSAMIGIWTASKTYDPEQGAFTTYAHQFIEGEINNLVYKITMIDGTKRRVPRIKEELVSDMLDDEMVDNMDHYDDPYLENKYFMDYLSGLPLQPKDKAFFVNMVKYGDTEATSLYVSVHNCTRQYANKLKQDIREIATKHSKEINSC